MLGGGFDASFAQHWDGNAWRRHPLPTYGRDVAVDGRRVAVVTGTAVLTWNGTAFVTEAELGGEGSRLKAVDTGGGRHLGRRAARPGQARRLARGTTADTRRPAPCRTASSTEILHVASDDVWAVGGTGDRPLLLHWDGRSWQRPAIPQASGELTGVTAFGPDDVWFAGRDPGRPGGISVLHWDGRAWTQESPPEAGPVSTRRSNASPAPPGCG